MAFSIPLGSFKSLVSFALPCSFRLECLIDKRLIERNVEPDHVNPLSHEDTNFSLKFI